MCKHFTNDGIKADNDDKDAQTRLVNAAKALDIDMNEYVSYEDLEERIADLSQQDKAKVTGGEIITRLAKHWLKENGYDGFVFETGACACSFKGEQVLFHAQGDDGRTCPWGCIPGYLNEDGNTVREKPEDPKEKKLKELEKDLKELGFDEQKIEVAIGVLAVGILEDDNYKQYRETVWVIRRSLGKRTKGHDSLFYPITPEDQKPTEEESSHLCAYWKPNKTKGMHCTFECGVRDSGGYSRCYAKKDTEPNCPFFKAID